MRTSLKATNLRLQVANPSYSNFQIKMLYWKMCAPDVDQASRDKFLETVRFFRPNVLKEIGRQRLIGTISHKSIPPALSIHHVQTGRRR